MNSAEAPSAVVIPFPTRHVPPAPNPGTYADALARLYSRRTIRNICAVAERQREETDRKALYEQTMGDLARAHEDAQLSMRGRIVFETLLRFAVENRYQGPKQAAFANVLGISPRTLATYLREIRGRGFDALGLPAQPVRELASWLADYVETGRPMCRLSDVESRDE